MRNFKQFLQEEILSTVTAYDVHVKDGHFDGDFPNKVGIFECNSLPKLTSLKGCPQEITKKFDCAYTFITSLKDGPSKVDQCFYSCHNTKITSLEYAPLKCSVFWCSGNNISNLQGVGKKYLTECERLWIPDTIESNILGLCKIKKLNQIEIKDKKSFEVTKGPLYEAIQIAKKHLQTDGVECMEELIQNGYNDYAKF